MPTRIGPGRQDANGNSGEPNGTYPRRTNWASHSATVNRSHSQGALMAELVVETEGVLAYGAVASTMAEQIAAASAAVAACGPAVLAPVFGLIGQEFLGAVTGTHLAHTDAVVRL